MNRGKPNDKTETLNQDAPGDLHNSDEDAGSATNVETAVRNPAYLYRGGGR